MDLWVIAAAAGAGYIAKNLQNLSLDTKETTSGPSYKYPHNVQSESRNLLQQLRDKTCPLRRLERKRAQDGTFLDVDDQIDVNSAEIDRSSNRDRESGDALERNRLLEDYNSGWISSLPSVLSAEETFDFEDGEIRNLRRVNNGSKFTRNTRSHVHSTRPLNRLGSCLDAEHENMGDKTCLYPFMSTARPVLVTDENRLITQFEGRSENGPEAMLLFVTGMTVGIMSATAAWKNEVDKSNKQLKQMHDLVQDLHEELDMKDVMMVKEIADEVYPPPQETDTPLSIREPIASPSDAKNSTEFDGVKAGDDDDRKTEDLELISKIEAELQAELEMLENNLKASALEKKYGVADLQPANYAVDPWELSLRLHELIESRLEKRVNELEAALSNSRNGDKVLGSQPIFPIRKFSYSETESSSTHHTPACICFEHDERDDGLFFEENFYADALLYKEPNGASLKMKDMDQENESQFCDKQISTSFISNEDCLSEDEGTDESEMLLIKQIVDRRKSGSNFNLKT